MISNSSFSENNLTDPDSASQFALRVALQTMKERCMSLQQRLITIEEENLALRNQYQQNDGVSAKSYESDECESLRAKLAELIRQKCQLTEHVAMVTTENRQLWSRLSQLTKNKNELSKDDVSGNQCLIRSKTFTQDTANILLRQKYNLGTLDNNVNDLSLEEVSLEVFQGFVGPSRHSKEDSNTDELYNVLDTNYSNAGEDLLLEAKKCNETMKNIKSVLLNQHNQFVAAVGALHEGEVLKGISDLDRKPKISDMVDNEEQPETYNACGRSPINTSCEEKSQTNLKNSKYPQQRLTICEKKIMSDEVDKLCPLCGKIYSNNKSFEDFQEHVEMHFIEDSEIDASIERNYEYISHTVGNF